MANLATASACHPCLAHTHLQHQRAAPCACVPHTSSGILAPGDCSGAVCCQHHAVDATAVHTHGISLALAHELARQLAGARVIYAHGAVKQQHHRDAAVCADMHALGAAALLLLQAERGRASAHVPADQLAGARGGECQEAIIRQL